MEIYDPTSWDERFVIRNKRQCLEALTAGISSSGLAIVEEGNYHKAVLGLGAALHGLDTMNSAFEGAYFVHLLLDAWCLANIVAITGIGPDGKALDDDDRIEVAENLYETCLEELEDVSNANDQLIEDIQRKLYWLDRTDKRGFKDTVEPDFPKTTLFELRELVNRL